MTVVREDIEALRQEKYGGDKGANMHDDLARLARGEPLAYVIGHVPFMGLSIDLSTHPLIPRTETEWWTEKLVARIGAEPLAVLDLCAGSGAIGLSVLKHCPNARVSFGEIEPQHAELIKENLARNELDPARADIRTGDLFEPFEGQRFDLVAANPPYVPSWRQLPPSVAQYEPSVALYGGADGLAIVRRLFAELPQHLTEGGEAWVECDVAHIEEAGALPPRSEILEDQYGRKRVVVAYY